MNHGRVCGGLGERRWKVDEILWKDAERSRGIALASLILGIILSLSGFDVYAADAPNINRQAVQGEQIQTQHNLIKAAQGKLKEKGYDPGPTDGILGPRTRKALEAFQRDHGLTVDGMPGKETLKGLGLM